MTKARILAIDTCTESCSSALLCDGDIISQSQLAPREHAKLLLPMVQQLLADAQMSLSQLDAIAFGRGPGSFTGVRIGTATAQGLAFGADLPVLPISTLQALARQGYRLSGIEQQLAAIDARMNEMYLGAYRHLDGDMVAVAKERVCPPEHWREIIESAPATSDWYATGSGWNAYLATLGELPSNVTCHADDLFPLAEDMVALAEFAWARGEAVDAALAQPVYLRDTVTWKKLPGRE
ncbi:tRNA (adenosine(37)-N6)-threonylcarbamoyltransferase complex dimerization subunit type 1 TsaB [Neiella marina]|uniref:tRNA threonylcarbamoyladenosine biosynthesis protein TsaB n=1 Tax=Neiella holothuriorum TaxID=2870530 RepID=A0ABS7ED46_9GAMM|nr:tRNA (adenosine(37)-N6)-threonylcarbamoyltransferase complex dimerization subunit type 1 TsaB [Neiella holothuriorum]MBW8190170.1 tRNA (adenosine(37)-N6)-threonylcarbamoyltransferase complex dimerization subunit type 1 TsaB [Neiella holothuriorum]